MILDKGHSLEYLEDWQDGKIPMGKGLGNKFTDQYIRFKDNQLNFILALDNLGKTHFMLWYFLCLSLKYGIVWDICAMENTPNSSMRRLIQMKGGEPVERMSRDKMYECHKWVDRHFNFFNHELVYKHDDLLKMFKDSNSNACFIDPYTGLRRDYGHVGNYNFLHDAREFVNSEKTLYTSLHTRTEAASRFYPKGHDLEGYVLPPFKALCEGGQPFANRADDFFTLHRHPSHPNFRYMTELHIQKIKETETGGQQTLSGEPLVFEFNRGNGFTIGGIDILREIERHNNYEEEEAANPIQGNWENDKDVTLF